MRSRPGLTGTTKPLGEMEFAKQAQAQPHRSLNFTCAPMHDWRLKFAYEASAEGTFFVKPSRPPFASR